jgi:uncharacterized membrane protein (UPF0127 family)
MARGLMGRTSLGQDEGMLFLMGRRAEHFFYMRQTRIALDLIFIDYDQVVGILTLATFDETKYGIGRPSTCVLEVNGNYANQHGILAGINVSASSTV